MHLQLAESNKWQEKIDQIREFLTLECGWDGFDALAPKEEIIESAICLAKILQNRSAPAPKKIEAGEEGSVRMIWSTKTFYLEIDSIQPYNADVFVGAGVISGTSAPNLAWSDKEILSGGEVFVGRLW